MAAQASSPAVLVMLAGNSCSPCYRFSGPARDEPALTLADFDEVCRWAMEGAGENPRLFFLAPETGPIDPSILSALTEVPDQVVVPLMSADQQEGQLGIPVSRHQTVVAGTLEHVARLADHIYGRSLILHVQREDAARLEECLLALSQHTSHVTLRPDDPHSWRNQDFELYQRQLESLILPYLTVNAIGRRQSDGMLDISALDVRKNRNDSCPVLTDFLVVGPDRHVYPCLAYYHAGQEYSLGRVPSTGEDGAGAAELSARRYAWHDAGACPGCPFLATRSAAARAGMGKLLAAERLARRHLISRAAGSNYLLDCLHILQTRNTEIQSRLEGGEDMVVSSRGQTHDISMDDFAAALHDIRDAAERAGCGSAGVRQPEGYAGRWRELPGLPFHSRRAVFRRRVQEIVATLSGLPSADGFGREGARAARPERLGEQPSPVRCGGNGLQPQPLSAEEMAVITVLHERWLGWSCLLQGIRDDRALGFPGEVEESVVRDQLTRAREGVARWFERMRERYGWPPFEQTPWEIDFVGGRAVPRTRGRDSVEIGARHQRVAGPQEWGQPFAYIGDRDATTIERLFERRATWVDYLRPSLCTLVGQTECPAAIIELVQQIGACERDIQTWFAALAEVCQWPTGEPERWMYQVDIGEDRIYRTPRPYRADEHGRQD